MTDEHDTSPRPDHDRLTRSPDRVVFGVAGGLADALGVDPVWIRLAFVVAAFLHGFGVMAYVVGLLLLPRRDDAQPRGNGRRIAAAILAFVAVSVLIDAFGLPHNAPVVAALLVGIAAALWRPRRVGTPTPSPVPYVAGTAVDLLPPPTADTAADGPPLVGETRRRVRPTRPPRPYSPLGRVTAAVALILGGILWAVGATALVVLGSATLVVAAGLLVGSVAGHARWLAVPGVVVLAATFGAASIKGYGLPDVWASTGNAYERPTVPTTYRRASGTFTLDLTAATGGTYTVRSLTGHVTVLTGGQIVEFSGRVGVGRITRNGSSSAVGYRRSSSFTTGPSDAKPGQPPIVVDVALGFGEIEVDEVDFATGEPRSPYPLPTTIVPIPGQDVGPDGSPVTLPTLPTIPANAGG